MNKKIKEIRDLIGSLKQKRDAIRTAAKSEQRELTEDQRQEIVKLNQQIEDARDEEREIVDDEIEERGNSRSTTIVNNGEGGNRHISERDQRDLNQFSLGRVLRTKLNGEAVSGIDAEIIQEGFAEGRSNGVSPKGNIVLPYNLFARNKEGLDLVAASLEARREGRDMTATGTTTVAGDQGGQLIMTTIGRFYEALYNRIILRSLGATFMPGLTGNLALPRFVDNGDPSWKSENAAADELNPTITTTTLSPKRLPTFIEISNQLLAQSDINIDATVKSYLINKLSSLFDKMGIQGSGTGNQPRGILNTTGIGAVYAGGAPASNTNADGAAPVWADIVNLFKETAIDNADFGRLAYLTNPIVTAKLQTTEKASNTAVFVMPEGAKTLNGYACGVTNNVPANLTKGASNGKLSSLIFGNFQDLWMGTWGGIDLLVNPYSKDTEGETRINAALYGDCAVARPESFAAIKDILA